MIVARTNSRIREDGVALCRPNPWVSQGEGGHYVASGAIRVGRHRRWMSIAVGSVILPCLLRETSEGNSMLFRNFAVICLTVTTTIFFNLASLSPCEAGPFSLLAGNWFGNGILTVGGAHEAIRCRAVYIVSDGGESLRQVLRCASDNYIIDVHADVVEQNGSLSGNWTETTSGASGSLSGFVRGPFIRGTISGPGFRAPLSLVTRGRLQHASISLGGSTLAEVVVTFHRD